MDARKMQVEFDQLITPDGIVYNLHDGINRFMITGISGMGLPPIEYITQRGPFQHGTTVKGYRLGERVLQMVHRRNGRSRFDHWDLRAELLNYVRPNRNLGDGFEPAVLRKVLPDGSKRDLEVRIEQGPTFDSTDPEHWDEWSIHEALRFVAADPTYYDPALVEHDFSIGTAAAGIMYPARYPVSYGPGGALDTTISMTYAGTWPAYPLITVLGPIDNLQIDNLTTGNTIELDYSIPDGVTVTIDLRYGLKTIEDDLGNNLLGTLTPESSIATFRVAESPYAAGGVNSIRIQGLSLISTSLITFAFNTRYIGI